MPEASLMQSLSRSARREVEKAAAAVRQREDLTKQQRRDLLRQEVKAIAALDQKRRQDTRPPKLLTQNVSDLAERAPKLRLDDERGRHMYRYATDVRRGRAKPPIVVLEPEAPARFWLGHCLRCDRELWVHNARLRVPVCTGCRAGR